MCLSGLDIEHSTQNRHVSRSRHHGSLISQLVRLLTYSLTDRLVHPRAIPSLAWLTSQRFLLLERGFDASAHSRVVHSQIADGDVIRIKRRRHHETILDR